MIDKFKESEFKMSSTEKINDYKTNYKFYDVLPKKRKLIQFLENIKDVISNEYDIEQDILFNKILIKNEKLYAKNILRYKKNIKLLRIKRKIHEIIDSILKPKKDTMNIEKYNMYLTLQLEGSNLVSFKKKINDTKIYKIKFTKFLKKYGGYSDSVISEIGEYFIPNGKIEILKGYDIIDAYNDTSHNSTCMSDNPNYCLEVYAKNPDIVRLLVIRDEFNEIVTRTLIWNLYNNDWIIDRIYSDNSFNTLSIKRMVYFKESIEYDGEIFTLVDMPSVNDTNNKNYYYNGPYKIKIHVDEETYMPYMDNFKFCKYDNGDNHVILSTQNGFGNLILSNSDATLLYDDRIWSEYLQKFIDEDRAVFSVYHDDYLDSQDVIWVNDMAVLYNDIVTDINNEYILEDDKIEIYGGGYININYINSYDVIYCEDNDLYAKQDDVVYSKLYGKYFIKDFDNVVYSETFDDWMYEYDLEAYDEP